MVSFQGQIKSRYSYHALTWWLSVDDFVDVLSCNGIFVVSLVSNLFFLREFIWERVRCIRSYFWNLLACSLAKRVEVRLFDNENKESNFFNMSLKTSITFEFSLQRTNLFFYIGFSKPCPSLPLPTRWCDSCPQHETWELAITFDIPGDLVTSWKKASAKNFNAVSHNRAPLEVLFSNLEHGGPRR